MSRKKIPDDQCRGFGYVNLTQMRPFYLTWPKDQILQTPSEESSGPKKAANKWPQAPIAESPAFH
jgi:hypothetical protein